MSLFERYRLPAARDVSGRRRRTYYLIDMGSRNGSFVNGMRVSVPAALNDGDTISLGDTTIEFRRDATRSIRPVSRKLTGETTVAHFASNRTRCW